MERHSFCKSFELSDAAALQWQKVYKHTPPSKKIGTNDAKEVEYFYRNTPQEMISATNNEFIILY